MSLTSDEALCRDISSRPRRASSDPTQSLGARLLLGTPLTGKAFPTRQLGFMGSRTCMAVGLDQSLPASAFLISQSGKESAEQKYVKKDTHKLEQSRLQYLRKDPFEFFVLLET